MNKPKSVKTCVLINKRERREDNTIKPDFYGFTIYSGFVVGYGLDAANSYRYLKGLYELPQALSS